MSDETQGIAEARAGALVRKETPSVLASFGALKRGRQQLKIRVLQYSKSEPIADIREYITSEPFNGFSKKGIALNLEQCRELFEVLPKVIEALESV